MGGNTLFGKICPMEVKIVLQSQTPLLLVA